MYNNHFRHPLDEDDTANEKSPRRQATHRKTDSFASRIPTLTPRNGEKSRLTFKNTRTLTGAFQATADHSRTPEDPNEISHRSKIPETGKGGRASVAFPPSPVSSPPAELYETYRQADVEHRADHIDDEFEVPQAQHREMRSNSPSPGPRRRETSGEIHTGATYNTKPNIQDILDEELRKGIRQREMDDRRLKRATGREQPVFSRAKMGRRATLSTENLQRRNEEVRGEEAREEVVDQGTDLPVNVPKTWGTRGRATKDWLSRTYNQDDRLADEDEEDLFHDPENDVIDFTAQSLQISNSPPVKGGSRNFDEPYRAELISQPLFTKQASEEYPVKPQGVNAHLHRDSPTKDTPITVYRSANYERAKIPNKEDSHEFLRKLARKESPSISNTPETKVPAKTPLNPKTPMVMGAWIDTPLPERSSNHVESTLEPLETMQEKPKEAVPCLEESKKEPPPKEPRRRRSSSIKLEKPNLPKSALAAVIEEAMSGNNSLGLEENTIDSLQRILEDNSTSSSDLLDSEKSGKGHLSSSQQGNTEQASEEALIDRLNSKLRSLVQNISEAKAGLVSLEDKAAKDATLLASRRIKQERPRLPQNGECEVCGFHDDGRRYLAIPIPRLWRLDSGSGRRHLTRLGWILMFLFIWQVFEALIETYRYHPSFLNKRRYMASRNPEWPAFVPGTIWRWLNLNAIWRPIRDTMFVCVKFIGTSLGLWDPFFDDWMYGEEWYGENWIQRYNHHVYPEFFRRESLVPQKLHLTPGFARPVAAATSASGRVMIDPDLSMDADMIIS
ncbi:hypothetical protein LOZ39_002324 [Ophidiomyces ophidiicola]|nr:hypothetical protein LOZ49_001422 [Ophidiomyces ophidiicola]KAI2077277.1 hypothetical protein LOZ39_002324 [Ophidiomyces ophidiicola]KAI2137234.1 hypothetical protein LOZ29_003253 [Ophidiomyces ophidiicola]KAI2139558.1 hypothetical protein LOZ28_003157 [Ophidiomyces ophidiicola]KAI2220901.1 hypothetical protein LOZ15_002046 [Ophidiomyces ophidiicola]